MLTGQIDSDGRRISSNTEASGRFHTDWLNMLYPRLKLARNLLHDEGVIVVSIDEREVITEAMAEVWWKQGNIEKAAEIYNKLKLLNPSKSHYFAAKIEALKNH